MQEEMRHAFSPIASSDGKDSTIDKYFTTDETVTKALSSERRSFLSMYYGDEWKVRYRATVDGWCSSDFHRLCDGLGPTVVVVWSGEYVFGGYLHESWHSKGKWITDSKASLFSFTGDIRCHFPVTDPQSAACGDSRYGPVFGGEIGGNDLHIASHSNMEPPWHRKNLRLPSHSLFPNSYDGRKGVHTLINTKSRIFTVDDLVVLYRS